MKLLSAPAPELSPVTIAGASQRWRWSRHAEIAAITALLLLSAVLRLAELNQIQYRYDDDALYNIVMRMVRTGQAPLAGLSSTIGLANGPFQAYLLAPFGWIGAPPLMTAGVAFLNILAVAIVYGFTRDFFGRGTALLALLFVGLNPWAVVLSRRLLGNEMVAPFAALSLWMLARWLFRRDERAILVAGAALAVVCQVYVIGLECLATAAVALLLAGRRLWRWNVAAAIALFATLMAPYIWTQAIPHLDTLFYIYGKPGNAAGFDFSAAHFALDLASNEGYQAFAAQGGAHLDATSGLPGALGLAARGLYLIGLATGLWVVFRGGGRWREQSRGIHLLMLTGALVPVVVLFRPTVLVRLLYLVTTFPMPYVYSALAVQRLWCRSAPFGWQLRVLARTVLAAIVGSSALVQLALAAVFLSVIGQYWTRSDYGIPWAMNDRLGQEALQLQRQHGAARILVLDDANDFNQVEWVMAEHGMPVGEFDDTRLLVLPGQPTVYLAPGAGPAQQELLTSYRRYLLREDRLPGDGTMVRFYLLPPIAATAPLPAGATPLNWLATGFAGVQLRLDGVTLPRRLQPGQSVDVTTFTTVLSDPPSGAPDFSIFVHLLSADGRVVAGRDDTIWPTHFWRKGDRVKQTLRLSVPAGAAPGVLRLSLGLYAATGVQPVTIRAMALADNQGRSLGASGTFPAALIPPPLPAPPEKSLPVQFAQGINLDGFDTHQDGSRLTVTPHWSAQGTASVDYTAFVHLLDPAGHVVAQSDGQPVGGTMPTTFWQPGDRIADAHTITLPSGLHAGAFRLEFGLYDLHTLQRLPVVSGQPEAAIILAATR